MRTKGFPERRAMQAPVWAVLVLGVVASADAAAAQPLPSQRAELGVSVTVVRGCTVRRVSSAVGADAGNPVEPDDSSTGVSVTCARGVTTPMVTHHHPPAIAQPGDSRTTQRESGVPLDTSRAVGAETRARTPAAGTTSPWRQVILNF